MPDTYKAVEQVLTVDEHIDYADTIADALARGFDAWANGQTDEFYLVYGEDTVKLVTFELNREVKSTDIGAEHSPELRLAQVSVLETISI